MKHSPKLTYCGLTIVLSNPSRFDKRELLSAFAGKWFNEVCLRPGVNRHQCEIRTSDDKSELLPATTKLLLLGERSFQEWTDGSYKDYTLNEQRGTPLKSRIEGVECIASYLPQDCMDPVDFESRLNHLAKAYLDTDEPPDEEEEAPHRKGRTSRSNYRFWLERDTKKLLAGRSNYHYADVELCPSSERLINFLSCVTDKLYFDIETDSELNLTCFGVGDRHNIYVVPVYRYDYTLAYDNTPRILAALAGALARCEVVIHNSMFDLFVLAHKYKIPFGRKIYDTMLAHHRAWPEAEKSLGHAMSHLTWEPYHKDEGIFQPQNPAQERQLWSYNAKDIQGMIFVREALDAIKIPGVQESIAQVNKSIYGYLVASLLGVRFDEQVRKTRLLELDTLMTQYLRCIKLLVGYEVLPTSPKACVEYFHDTLGYKEQARSKTVSKRTGKRGVSLSGVAMQKLKLAYPDNVVIDFILAYRELSKEHGMLTFTPWKTGELQLTGN